MCREEFFQLLVGLGVPTDPETVLSVIKIAQQLSDDAAKTEMSGGWTIAAMVMTAQEFLVSKEIVWGAAAHVAAGMIHSAVAEGMAGETEH